MLRLVLAGVLVGDLEPAEVDLGVRVALGREEAADRGEVGVDVGLNSGELVAGGGEAQRQYREVGLHDPLGEAAHGDAAVADPGVLHALADEGAAGRDADGHEGGRGDGGHEQIVGHGGPRELLEGTTAAQLATQQGIGRPGLRRASARGDARRAFSPPLGRRRAQPTEQIAEMLDLGREEGLPRVVVGDLGAKTEFQAGVHERKGGFLAGAHPDRQQLGNLAPHYKGISCSVNVA